MRTSLTNKIFSKKGNTAKGRFYTSRPKAVNTARPNTVGHPQKEDQGYVDSGCSRHMTSNMSYLSDFKEFDGGYVTFRGGAKGGRITGKGTLKTVFLKKSLNCLDCKGPLDESCYGHRRLEFKNRVMSEFCEKKGIKKEFSVARTPQQNGVAERRNRTLIEAARTMLADSKLPTTFWAEAVNTACYVQNRVLVVKPHNKTPYELFRGKFDGKSDEGFFVGYSLNSKAFRVYNIRTRKVEENLHIRKYVRSVAVQTSNDLVVTTAPLEATHSDFFGDETEVDISNITTTYPVPSTPNTRIHKDHSLDHVIGDVQSGVQTRRMTKTTNEQGFIRRAQKGNPSIKISKLDRSYARRASAVQVTTGLDLGGFTTWQKSHWYGCTGTKKNFRYLKGQPKLGLWYPKDSPFDLEAYTDSDYAGASLDRKSTIGGCQFLGSRLISWQCKKQTVVANSTTKAEYVAAASCCGQVLWIQNQMLDYGYNFMNTKIFIDNESTICIVKNPVFHSKTKHIEIRHHFIRDSNEKKLIQMIKIHTDQNVADLLTKAFDVGRFQYGFWL
ncbi:putative ribonuclease H-like domain-containing protein [Tanacetum coccineum]